MRQPTRREVLGGLAGAGAVTLAGCRGGTAATGTPGQPLTSVSDVPVGGGVVLPQQAVVVTQPEAGTFRGFDATCTHAGCLVADVVDGQIVCSCHGSRFSAGDGSVVQGPATAPLPSVAVSVSGTEVVRA